MSPLPALSLAAAFLPPAASPPLPANFHLWPPAMQRRYREHALGGKGPAR
ncbi:MAG: hypothetical protein JNK37_06000 [Verrucomicrobiales bacterium]|nr:hypothetical protein [Verrucomicrobiales bacterium]